MEGAVRERVLEEEEVEDERGGRGEGRGEVVGRVSGRGGGVVEEDGSRRKQVKG